MKTFLRSMVAVAVIHLAPAHAEDATGYWSGAIGGALRVVLAFDHAPDGQWRATITVPQQHFGARLEQLVVTPERISLAVANLDASYTAQWNPAAHAWVGTWRQHGQTAPLALTRSDASAMVLNRPQEAAIAARNPGYRAMDVTFAGGAAGVTLAGTLTVPPGKGPFPAVVLVHGSGPSDRDEDIFDHKLFLVLADDLTRRGIAVLRYDKRGVKASTGDYQGATSYDFADDAAAAVRFLRGRPGIDPRHTGIVGHSEGGMIAPLVASKDPGVAFVVMLAGPGVRGEVLMPEQIALIGPAHGKPDAQIAQERALDEAMFAILAAEPDVAVGRNKAGDLFDAAARNGTLPAGMDKDVIARFSTPWFLAFLRHDPVPVLQAVHQPILALNGALDRQVPAALDLPAIRTALRDNPRATVQAMPQLNHLFQTAQTGAGAEYGAIEETFAPGALALVGDWILATAR